MPLEFSDGGERIRKPARCSCRGQCLRPFCGAASKQSCVLGVAVPVLKSVWPRPVTAATNLCGAGRAISERAEPTPLINI